jgi:hypothetical protein
LQKAGHYSSFSTPNVQFGLILPMFCVFVNGKSAESALLSYLLIPVLTAGESVNVVQKQIVIAKLHFLAALGFMKRYDPVGGIHPNPPHHVFRLFHLAILPFLKKSFQCLRRSSTPKSCMLF